MKGTDTALHLPAHAEAIREKVEGLWSTWFAEEWTIGGGSVLAAWWHHRWSEDLDTGCSAAAWAHTTERNAPEALVERITQALLPWRADRVEHTDGTGTQGLEAHAIRDPRSTRRIGSLSIYTERGILEPRPSQPVAGSTARAWSTAEILVRKLLGRGSAMLPRDVYDYAVACEREPHAWRHAIGRVRRAPLERLRYTAHRARRQWNPNEIIEPSDPSLAWQAADVLAQVLDEEVRKRGYEPGPAKGRER